MFNKPLRNWPKPFSFTPFLPSLFFFLLLFFSYSPLPRDPHPSPALFAPPPSLFLFLSGVLTLREMQGEQ